MNVGCGDQFQVQLKMDENNKKIKEVMWQGHGCAISTASMSVLSDEIQGKTADQVRKITQQDLLDWLGLEEINLGREKCLLLGLRAVLTALDSEQAFTTDIEQTVDVLKNGGVIIIPTDTVWGLACSVESAEGIKKFYEIKNREPEKPTAILVGSFEQAENYGQVNDRAKELTDMHWPGALTIVVESAKTVPASIKGNTNSVGLRWPNVDLITQLTQALGAGLVTGSANFSGDPSPFKKSELNPELIKKVDLVFDGECGGQPPSTVVDCTKEKIHILRQGPIKVQT
jgi:L-threonylcarbamoyladenylate synthase